jgi:hypothetical protein
MTSWSGGDLMVDGRSGCCSSEMSVAFVCVETPPPSLEAEPAQLLEVLDRHE